MTLAAMELSELLKRLSVPCAVVETPDAGKHVKALTTIAEGTILFEERPIVCWPLHRVDGSIDSTLFCDHCMATGGPMTPCLGCEAHFCSSECMAAGSRTHRFLCGALSQLRAFHKAQAERMGDKLPAPISVESMARCAATIAARYVSLSEGNPGVSEAQLFDHAAHSFNRLLEPPQGTAFEDIDAREWCTAVREAIEPRIVAHTGPRVADGILSDATLTTLLGELTINAQGLLIRSSVDGGTPMEAAAVFTLQSCFNHSCVPNATVVCGTNADIAIKALRDVPEGSELSITYLPPLVLEKESAVQRRERLKAYFFTCKCPRCTAEDEG